MPKIKITILLLFAFVFTGSKLMAQENHEDFKSWPELKNFHEVIAQTFHPSEEGNFKPIRQRSAELRDKAIKLNEAKIPEGFEKEGARGTIKALVLETTELNEVVQKNVSDEDLKNRITKIHSLFHKLISGSEKGESSSEKK